MSLKTNISTLGYKIGILTYIFNDILKVRWVNVNDDLGLRIFGINFVYYKWPDPMINLSKDYRVMDKREFGEGIHPQK